MAQDREPKKESEGKTFFYIIQGNKTTTPCPLKRDT